MSEVWKQIEGFDKYEISSYGRVRSKAYNSPKILSSAKRKDGYCRITLCNKGYKKNYFIHRLVAEAFIDNPYNYEQVNHKDENKSNNSVGNLEWCDCEYNKNYSNGYSVEQFTKDGVFVNKFDGIRKAQRETHIERTTIKKCCDGIYKSAGGFVWKYSQGSFL